MAKWLANVSIRNHYNDAMIIRMMQCVLINGTRLVFFGVTIPLDTVDSSEKEGLVFLSKMFFCKFFLFPFFLDFLIKKRTDKVEACERCEKQRMDKGAAVAANTGVRGALDSFGIKTDEGPW